jgi:uncharacterized protein YjbI with pentapeptide repeats
MANLQQLELLLQGAETWNQWRKGNPGLRPDLLGADLSGSVLSRAQLGLADFSFVYDFSGANLSEAKIDSTNFGD